MLNNQVFLKQEDYYKEIYNKFQKNGFVTNSYVEDVLLSHDIPLAEIENVYNKIVGSGILIISSQEDIDKYTNDYGFYDYSKMYDEIIIAEPNLENYVNKIKQIRPPQWHELDNLFPQAKNGNKKARERIIEMNLRVALRQAYYYYNRYGLPLEDAIQEANYGLVRAYEKYDDTSHVKFQNHIQWYIRGELDRRFSFCNSIIEYPLHITNQLQKIHHIVFRKSEGYIYKHYDRLLKKMHDVLGCSKTKAKKYFACFNNVKCIDLPYFEDENIFSDLELQIYYLNEKITNDLLKSKISNILATLPLREAEIIKLRFGLNDYEPLTLEDLGDYFNLTRERIRQIEAKALRGLRHPKRCRSLVEFFENKIKEPSDKNLPKQERFIEG